MVASLPGLSKLLAETPSADTASRLTTSAVSALRAPEVESSRAAWNLSRRMKKEHSGCSTADAPGSASPAGRGGRSELSCARDSASPVNSIAAAPNSANLLFCLISESPSAGRLPGPAQWSLSHQTQRLLQSYGCFP